MLDFYVEGFASLALFCAGGALIVLVINLWRRKQYEKTDYYAQTGNDFDDVDNDLGKRGEYLTSEKLKSLQGYKKYLYNCYFPKENGETTEIDVILLHESGIYVMESKNYSGWIFGNEDQRTWTQSLKSGKGKSQKKTFLNPIIQNKGHIKWLKQYLGEEKEYPIYSYIVFSERCELKDVTVTSGEHHVIKREHLLQAVQQNVKTVGVQLSNEEIDALYEKLQPLTKVDEAQKQAHIEKIQEKKEQTCPKCGGKLVLRTAKNGEHAGNQFWGCSNYPKCNYIKNK